MIIYSLHIYIYIIIVHIYIYIKHGQFFSSLRREITGGHVFSTSMWSPAGYGLPRGDQQGELDVKPTRWVFPFGTGSTNGILM